MGGRCLLRVANGGLVTDREFVAALGTPARKHSAAIRSLHTLAKSVGLRPVPIVRLKRTFWHSKILTVFCWEPQPVIAKLRAGPGAKTHCYKSTDPNIKYKGSDPISYRGQRRSLPSLRLFRTT